MRVLAADGPERFSAPRNKARHPAGSPGVAATSRAPAGLPRRVVVTLALLIAAVSLLWLVAGAQPAAAHARLVATEPTDGARLAEPPAGLALSFDESVHVGPGAIRLRTSTGDALDIDARHRAGGRDVVEAPLPRLESGAYTVQWRVTSVDAEPITGTFSFAIAPTTPASTIPSSLPTPSAASAPPPDPGATGHGLGIARAATRFAGFTAMLVLVGAALHTLVLRPQRALIGRTRALVQIAAVLLAVTGAAVVVVGAAHAAGVSLGHALDRDVMRPFLETAAARAAIVRVVLAFAVLAAVVPRWMPFRHRTPAVVGGVSLLVVSTFAMSGHAISGTHIPVAIAADTVHLAAAGVWIGGLVSLLVLGGLRDERAARRFSTSAAWAVALLVATGSISAWRQLRTLAHVTDTDYGRTLLIKLALVGALLALGTVSRHAVRRSLHDRLARIVAAETAVAVLVLVATTALVSTPPAEVEPAPAPHTAAASDRP